jgi:hypothetical protein
VACEYRFRQPNDWERRFSVSLCLEDDDCVSKASKKAFAVGCALLAISGGWLWSAIVESINQSIVASQWSPNQSCVSGLGKLSVSFVSGDVTSQSRGFARKRPLLVPLFESLNGVNAKTVVFFGQQQVKCYCIRQLSLELLQYQPVQLQRQYGYFHVSRFQE